MTDARNQHRHRQRARGLGLALAVAGVLGFILMAHLLTGRQPTDRIVAAAAAQEHFAFEGTTGWAQGDGSGRFLVAGVAEPFGPMTVAVRGATTGTQGPSSGPDRVVGYRIAWPQVEPLADLPVALSGGPSASEVPTPSADPTPPPMEPAAIAWHLPAGDPLGLVAAAHGATVGNVEPIGNRRCERIDFRVAGRAYVDWLRDHSSALPANGGVSGLERLEGQGSVWRDADTDLPCRVAVTVALPRFAGANPGEGSADWVYTVP